MIDNESLQNLEKLHQLKTDGVITEADFEAAKERLLNGSAKAEKAVPAARVDTGHTHTLGEKFDGTLPPEDRVFAWMILPLRRYADFTGRSCRKEYWMFLLMQMIVIFCLGILIAADTGPFGVTGGMGNLATLLLILGGLGTVVPSLAVQARRFHDQNKSGWLALLNFIPYVGTLIVLAFMLVGSDEGENRFGPAPR